MRILFDLIDADQAAQLTEESIEAAGIAAIDYVEIRKQKEISDIDREIQSAANMGLAKVSCWIRYEDTYDRLLTKGYKVDGGVICENLPEALRTRWGEQRDKFVISWETL